MSSWLEKLTLLIGPRGYSDCMRRSLQSVILYEAKRCLEADLPSLKPFQRKVALMDQAAGLIESLPFLMPHQREEILWRTATSKEQINGDIAYKRIQQINKELQKLCTQIKPFIVPSTSHQEWVNQLEQHLFESAGDNQGRSTTGRSVPPNWAHGHNHVILCFRLYYNGDKLDPDFPKPILPRPLKVPLERPRGDDESKAALLKGGHVVPSLGSPTIPGGYGQYHHQQHHPGMMQSPPLALTDPLEHRRKILSEVREHLDLLKEFEGIISDDDLAQRKKELFRALPPAPPPAKDKPSNNNNSTTDTSSALVPPSKRARTTATIDDEAASSEPQLV